MRTETTTRNIYTIHELCAKAKEKALEDWCNSFNYGWWSDNQKSLKWFESRFNIDVEEYNYETYGIPYIRFSVRLDGITYDEGYALVGQRLANWLMYHHFDGLYQGKWYCKNYPKQRRSKVLFEESCPTGYCMDYSLLEPIREFIKKPCPYTTYKDLMKECLNSWLADCQDDWEAPQTMEYFVDMCDANEYEFDEHGEMI